MKCDDKINRWNSSGKWEEITIDDCKRESERAHLDLYTAVSCRLGQERRKENWGGGAFNLWLTFEKFP